MFDRTIIDAARQHALDEFPKESCGLVVVDAYVPCENTHDDPENGFAIAPGLIATYGEENVLAVVHSHTDGSDGPSRIDMEQQWAMAKPWGIILCDGVVTRDPFWFGDEVPMPPLEGRSFRHGVTDCFSLVRDYYRSERGILLPYSPRDNAWWQDHRDPVSREVVFKAQNLYEDALAQLPFRKLRDSEPLEPGDGMLFAIRSATGANHGAVYVGDGMMLHHPAPLSPRDGNSLSRKELVARYHNFRTGYYRWEG